MANPEQNRQALYDRIRASSKQEVILAEMKRLGFWDSNADIPQISEAILKRRNELERELRRLYQQQNLYQHPEQALKAMRKQRMKQALEKREITKQKRIEVREKKVLAWHEQQQNGITWLGEAVSVGLRELTTESERLVAYQLPVLTSPKVLAEAMGISINELRFLAYQRQTSKVNHYQRFQIAKKTGGMRNISAPMPRLKRVQYWILDNLLYTQSLHPAAHGFVPKRSIITNAEPHIGKAVVINLDLQNFFPSIAYKRVKGLFKSFGYSEALATILGLLCTESEVDEVTLDGEDWYVMRGERHLPQGAPTSPMLSNLITRTLDCRLQGLADKYGFTYTRYADDLTFSCHTEHKDNVQKLLWAVQRIVHDEDFALHPDKTRIMRRGSQQEVTGLIVNDQLSIERKTLKRFRALLQQVEQSGLAGKTWNGATEPQHVWRSMLGYAHFVAMVNPEKGEGFKTQLAALRQQQGNHSLLAALPQRQPNLFRQAAKQGKALDSPTTMVSPLADEVVQHKVMDKLIAWWKTFFTEHR